MINFLLCYSWNKFAHWVFCKLHTVSIFKNVNQGHLGWDREDKERESKSLSNSIFHLDYVISSLLLIYVISLSKHHDV